jgi:hypothetical protein
MYDPENSIHDTAHAGHSRKVEQILQERPEFASQTAVDNMQPLRFQL